MSIQKICNDLLQIYLYIDEDVVSIISINGCRVAYMQI